MTRTKNISIVICTRNRADHLRNTLAAMENVCVPLDLKAELLVIDNGSTDSTASVVRSNSLKQMEVRYVSELNKGKGYAYNRGLAEAKGEILLWTDDDIRPYPDWMIEIIKPIVEDKADACTGRVVLPRHLHRDWLTQDQLSDLAITTEHFLSDPPTLIGANMAFHRRVLRKVPAFDLELGPGALGFNDEVLFSRQLQAAGFRLTGVPESGIEHHFDPDRLTTSAIRDRRWKQGRSDAYVAHHWSHETHEAPLRKAMNRLARLTKYRLRRKLQGGPHWNVPDDLETLLCSDAAFFLQYKRELRRPRNYEKRGCIKQRGLLAPEYRKL